jgi:hypothetical protein
METLEDRSLPSSTTWTGLGADTNWSTAANWSNGVPAAGDTVVFNSTAGSHNQSTVDAAFTGTVAALDISWSGTITLARSLTVNQEMALGNGTVTGGGDLTVKGTFNWTGGTLSGTGTATVPSGSALVLSFGGNRTLDHRAFINAGAAVWTEGGSFKATNGAIFTNSGTFDDQNNQIFSDNSGTFINTGTFMKSAGTGTTTFNATFNNNGTVQVLAGTLNLADGSSSAGSFTVAGGTTLQFSGGTATLTGNSSISGTGTVKVTNGTVNLGGAYNVTGTTQVTGGTATFSHAVTNLGVVTVSGGTADFSTGSAITVASLTLSGGTLTGSSAWTVAGTMTWSGGGALTGTGSTTIASGATLNLDANANKTFNTRTLTNNGKLVYQGDSGLNGSGVLNNNNYFDDQGNFKLTGSIRFNNAGTFTKSVGTNTTQFQDTVQFNNSGTVNVLSGTLNVAGGGDTSSGTFNVSAPGILQFGGAAHTLTAASKITGDGTVIFNGGTTTLAGTYDLENGPTKFTSTFGTTTFTGPVLSLGTTLDMSGGGKINFSGGQPITIDTLIVTGFDSITGSDDLTVTRQFNWSGGVMSGTGTTTVADSATLTLTGGEDDQRNLVNNGTINWNSGNFTLNTGATFTNNGTLNDNGDHSWSSNGSTFENAGAYVKTAGTGTTAIGPLFNNSGSVDIQSGTLTLTNGGTEDGSFTVEDGATLDLNSGNFTFSGSSSVTGFNTGTVILNTNTTVAGTYDLGTGTTKVPNTFATVAFTSPVTSVGSILNVDGYVEFSGGNPISVDTLTLTTFGTVTGTDEVDISGTLSWNAGVMSGTGSTNVLDSATATFDGNQYANLEGGRSFTNNGTVNWVGSADITLNDGATFTNNGSFTDATDHGLSGNGGTFNNNGTFVKVAGPGTTTVGSNLSFFNSGLASMQSGTLYIVGGQYTQITGQTDIGAGAFLQADGGVVILDGSLSGYGSVNGDVFNSGTVLPGEDGSPGILTINGNYTQTATGTLNLQIDDPNGAGFDQLAIAGNVALDGTLNVTLLNGYLPNSGDSFPVLFFASSNGTFASVVGDGTLFTVNYDPNDVTLVMN